METSYLQYNKLPIKYDDPLDVFLKKYIDKLIVPFKQLGFTPNMITTISFLFGLLSCYLYYKQYYIIAGICYSLFYFFDVMDGYYARIYKLYSTFGSYYDIISNLVVIILLFYLFITNKHIKPKNTKIYIFILLVLFSILMLYHTSCQEKYTQQNKNQYVSEGLSFVNMIKCNNTEKMKYTKYFGTGNNSLLVVIIIISHVFFTTN
jgi:phosphatidylglycerophosphate synthase